MALVAAIDIEQSSETGAATVIGSWCEPPSRLLATAAQRRHECGTDERLAGALRELLG